MAVNSLFQITGAVPKKVSTLSMPVKYKEKKQKGERRKKKKEGR